MLIRLSKPSLESGGGGVVKPLLVDTVTVACPDHLVLADLPVAKGIGAATAASVVKTAGRRSRRQLGERVHFCVRCDFPIAIYGRLSPCEHAFCLDCARSDSICYLCDERIQKIQTIKLMEGIFICAAPHCLKSFLKRVDFESHIQESHADLLQSNSEKEFGNDTEVQSTKQHSVSDSTARAPSRPLISPSSNSQFDSEDKPRRQQVREQPLARPMMQPRPPFFGQGQNYPSDPQLDSSRPPGFDRPGIQNHFQHNMQGGPQQESNQGILPDIPMPEYPPMHPIQLPNFGVPMNPNPMMTPQYGHPPFQSEGGQQFYGGPYDMGQMARPDSASEAGAEQGSLLGFPPGVNMMPNYPQPWNSGPAPGGQGIPDGYSNMSDSRGNVGFYQGDYGLNPGVAPIMPHPPPSANKGMEGMQGGNAMDARENKGMSVAQPYQHLPPPPPPLPHASQPQRGKYYNDDMGRDGQGYGWQHENRDSYGTGQE
ncbi:E3 ubiquitin-protein ligase HAKAI homolog [Mercurialis annua]|uniref:E3 ubiquitin-protein ligase HAKAI homolog n=1 Tax=Mercurialis annua TaxID=3986 RepID=UPI00215E8B01|nr:E3 ubiquitin-protein ligase HAKAI homolog [Mercurialis annua]